MTNDSGPLGEVLLSLCRSASDSLVLCAPFVKVAVLERLLAVTPSSVDIHLFTRWRPEEIAAGVTDTGVLSLIERRGGSVHLNDALHAKYYRNELCTLLGSANLTGAALGWSFRPNLEILAPGRLLDIQPIEDLLWRDSIKATPRLAEEAESAAALLPPRVVPEDLAASLGSENRRLWTPVLRQPADLFIAYDSGAGRLSRASGEAALHDLRVLDVPAGLRRMQFYAVVAHRLLQQEIIRDLDSYLSRPRRFGEVRDRLAAQLQLDRQEASLCWQTLMRWVLEFLPERYQRRVFNRSEALVRRY